MKNLMVKLFVIGVLLAGYAMPVLASGGGGPGQTLREKVPVH